MKIKILNDRATIPTKGSDLAAGYDLYSAGADIISIEPGETVKIPTGIAMAIPNNFFGAVFPRSGLATKQGLRLANCVAVIDPDYRGEWFIPIHNDSKEVRIIKQGDRIAQVVFIPFLDCRFETVDELDNTERGDGGFGSTGVR